jgi:hypothetical protein
MQHSLAETVCQLAELGIPNDFLQISDPTFKFILDLDPDLVMYPA